MVPNFAASVAWPVSPGLLPVRALRTRAVSRVTHLEGGELHPRHRVFFLRGTAPPNPAPRSRDGLRWWSRAGIASISSAAATRNGTKRSTRPSDPRIESLQSRLRTLGVNAFIVPTDDPHLSEVPPECFARRAYVSKFTGTAGTVVVTADGEALLWTDGRYFLQAESQLSEGWKLMKSGVAGVPSVEEWLARTLEAGQVVAIDPTVHPAMFVSRLRNQVEAKGASVRCLSENPVDEIWGTSRPAMPSAPVRVHPVSVAGKTALEKLEKVRAKMREEGADALVVSALDEVGWLLNIRGGDVTGSPVVLAYAVVEMSSATLFAGEDGNLPEEVVRALDEAGVTVKPYFQAEGAVAHLMENRKDIRVWCDPDRTNYALWSALGPNAEDGRVAKPSVVAGLKAVKNASELEGMRAAHRRDGAALAVALCKLEADVRSGNQVSEVDVDHQLTAARAASSSYLENSFPTIAGYGPNGAIIHYRADPQTAAVLGTSALLLIDSGAQYVDGTTDVTRTLHFGVPTRLEKECYTRVLRGHIAMATATFPEGTPGFIVDAFARRPLWEAGLDYRHGTGHGVGAALCVHEGPQRISSLYDNKLPLEECMIVSNEPGYYCDGEFGIRLENLMIVVQKNTVNNFDGKRYLGFEPLTFVPFQINLLDVEQLNEQEKAYIDSYHEQVKKTVGPILENQGNLSALAWLDAATRPLLKSRPPSSERAVTS